MALPRGGFVMVHKTGQISPDAAELVHTLHDCSGQPFHVLEVMDGEEEEPQAILELLPDVSDKGVERGPQELTLALGQMLLAQLIETRKRVAVRGIPPLIGEKEFRESVVWRQLEVDETNGHGKLPA